MSLIDKFVEKTEFSSYKDFMNGFKLNIPEHFNFGYDVVDEYARTSPNKRALVWCNDRGEERIFSFKDIKEYSNKVANVFKSYGIKKGDFVLVMLKRRYQYWFVSIALHKLGAVLIPATHLLTKKDIVFRCNRADVKAVVLSDSDDNIQNALLAKKECDTLETIFCLKDVEGCVNLDTEIEKADANFVREYEGCKTDPLLLYFTSGTTGNPKMVLHNHTYPLAHIITGKYWLDNEDDGLHFTLADTGWGKASWGKLYGQWISGTAIFVYDFDGKFHPIDLLPLVEKYQITSFCAPPTAYRFLIKEDLSKFNFSSLRHLSTAGEPLNPEIFRKMKEFTGLEIKEGFGQTETVCSLATNRYSQVKIGSLGLPTPIYDIHLLNNNGKDVADGVQGEICFDLKNNPDSVGLAVCYYKDEEATNKTWRDGFYHTGDLAYKDEDGYFWFVGRIDDVIKSSGYRIGPFEVESALMEHPAVLECAITAVPDELRGQLVKATIILAKGYEASEELKKELQNHVKKTTAPYKYPRIVEFVKELPKTISGKIRRVEIRNNDKTKKD